MQKIAYLRKFSLKVQFLEHFSVYLHAVSTNRENGTDYGEDNRHR